MLCALSGSNRDGWMDGWTDNINVKLRFNICYVWIHKKLY
jgi:hypothetical protein